MGQFQYHTGGVEQLDLIRPLWERLKEHEASLPGHFAGEFSGHNFLDRRAAFIEKGKSSGVFIDLVSLAGTRKFIAYAISTLSPEKHGEIENIFVHEDYRGYGLGSELMRRVLARMDGLGAVRKSVVILCENHAATRFYGHFGFCPRTTTLVQLKK